MKFLSIFFSIIFFTACAQLPQKSNSERVKEMAEKALKICGEGNVESVTVQDFKCRK